jgi:hypothetical protein
MEVVMNRKKTLGISIGILLLFASLAYALPPRVSWTPAELKPASIAPGQSASYTLKLKHTGILPIPATNQLRIVAEGAIVPFVTLTQPNFPSMFKRGNEVSVRVTVRVPTTTVLSVKTGQLVLNRILPNGRVSEVWRAEALPVELTFSSFHLPPAPNKALDEATILGIDSDGNHVPDRVDRWIAFEAPNSEKTRAALTQIAKNKQAVLLNANDKDSSIIKIREGKYANECLTYILGIDDTYRMVDEMKAEMLNTFERSRAWIHAVQNFSGEFSFSTPIAERKSRWGVVTCWGMVGVVPETTPQTSR